MKSVLITGANRGLGFELVKVFATEGWQVYAASRGKRDFSEVENESNITELVLDVTSKESINELVKQISTLDVLINNAGVYDAESATSDEVLEGMEEVTGIFRVNSVAPRFIADALTPALAKGESKIVMTIGSAMSSFEMADDFSLKHWAYSSSKTAMCMAMLGYAHSNSDVLVSMIHPGWMQTDMGGPNATVDPEDSAQKIYTLVVNPDKIAPEKMIDVDGKVMPF